MFRWQWSSTEMLTHWDWSMPGRLFLQDCVNVFREPKQGVGGHEVVRENPNPEKGLERQ